MEENFFNGEFVLLGYETSENGIDWVCGYRDDDHHDNLFDWKFEQKSVLNLLSGNIAYGGIFSVRLPVHPPTKSTYVYYATEKILYINNFECSGGFRTHHDIYKVDQLTQTEFLLYPLINSRIEPGFYRMILKGI